MNLRIIGCSFRSAPVAVREKLAFAEDRLPDFLRALAARHGCEAAVLSTCNRVEIIVARPVADGDIDTEAIAVQAGEHQNLTPDQFRAHLYTEGDDAAIRHLFRVTASLDSLVVGEGQIAAQVKKAYEVARRAGSAGPFLNALFPAAARAAKRARTETGIAQGHVSVSSVAVDYVRQVFDHFDDKTVLVVGAGKMGQLTLKHLRELKPKKILVANRSPEKAAEMAAGCGGTAIPWDQLDGALVKADIVLSTTGASEIVVDRRRYDTLRPRRGGRTLVILDIAVPRDFDPAIHDGETTFLFNIDDLTRVREQTLHQRQRHVAPAELIVEQEGKKFREDWSRRKNGPLIALLTGDFEGKRRIVTENLFAKLNGRLSEADRAYIEGAFRLYQNQLLHGPIEALRESARDGSGSAIADAIRRIFKLG